MAATQTESPERYGIILSAGNGTRLREFVYRNRADYLPKQYLNFIGKRSMLEHSLQRAERLISAQKLLVVVAREHLDYEEVRRQIASRPPQCVVIQPENKDTGPGILLPLMYVCKRNPDASVAVFPSDHFVLEEDVFMRHVDRAFRVVERDGSCIVLLGTEPNEADSDFGYIVPGATDESGSAGRNVELFVEKPATEVARTIIKKGALWNTLILAFRCQTLLKAIQRTAPELYSSFTPILNAIGTPHEQRVIERVYRRLSPTNFSKRILQALPHEQRQSFLVLPVRGVTWNDWGTSERILSSLRQLGKSSHLEQEGQPWTRKPPDHQPQTIAGSPLKKAYRV
jgi:mannose-1-phosphate guanylyltransferase